MFGVRAASVTALLIATALVLTACGGTTSSSTSKAVEPTDWQVILGQAKGQTVKWYMWGGDETLNTFVSGYVTDQLNALGVHLNVVKVTDTADAVNKVLGEKQAGKNSDGSVDLVWVNGENFSTGVQANLWSCGFDEVLPNAKYVDFASSTIKSDFGVPVNGCEAVWQQANSALVYDSAKLQASDVQSVSTLLDWTKAHPGQFTYPALPDFTGSMAVRTMLYDTVGGPSALSGAFDQQKYDAATSKLWPRLNAIEPSLWRKGTTYPQSQEAVEKLYADGEISAFFTYGPGAVGDKVSKGTFTSTTREAVLSGGNIANNSFVAIPSNAAHRAGALVLANLLEDPQTQLALYKAEGIYPGIDVSKTDAATQKQFAEVPVSPSVLSLAELTRNAQPELTNEYVKRIETDWKSLVLQK